MRRPTTSLHLIVVVLACLGVASSCADDGGGSGSATTSTSADDGLRGMSSQPPPVVSNLSLPDASAGGAELTFEAAPGELLLVYFGYTHCPDVCPTTLADTRTALRSVGSAADDVDVAMITIDPERDTGEILTGYVQSFVDGAHALVTGDDTRLRAVADAFGADYRVEEGESGEPEVSHTGFLYVVDDQGRLLVRWPFGTTADDLAHDITLLLQQEATT